MSVPDIDLNFVPSDQELSKQYANKELNLNDLKAAIGAGPSSDAKHSLSTINEERDWEEELDEKEDLPELPSSLNEDSPYRKYQEAIFAGRERPTPFETRPDMKEDPAINFDPEQPISSYAGSDLTPEEEERKKKVLLFKLKRFQRKGYSLSRTYNLQSDLIEIQSEFESIKREANLSATVETMKKGLSVGTYAIEMINTRFNPIGAKLEGWSSQVKDDIQNGDYDEVFEDLYDKYTDSVAMPPEMRLISMLGTSALQYHIAQVIVNQTITPDRGQRIIKQNPQLKKDIVKAVEKSNVGQNIHKQMKNPSDIDGLLNELEIEEQQSMLDDDDDPLNDEDFDAPNVISIDF